MSASKIRLVKSKQRLFFKKTHIKSDEYSWQMSTVNGFLPLQLGLKCERVLSELAHVQNALGQSDGAVV